MCLIFCYLKVRHILFYPSFFETNASYYDVSAEAVDFGHSR